MNAKVIVLALSPLIVDAQSQTQGKDAYETVIDKELAIYGLTDQVLGKLKASGIDVRDSLRQRQTLDETIQAVFSELVIIGEVLKTIDTPTPRTEPFHSKVLIRIIEVLRGHALPGDTVAVLKESGPILNENKLRKVSSDVRLGFGEKVLLFLDDPQKNSYIRTYYRDYFGKRLYKRENNAFWVDSFATYGIKDGKAKFHGRERNLDEIARNVRAVDKILSSFEKQ